MTKLKSLKKKRYDWLPGEIEVEAASTPAPILPSATSTPEPIEMPPAALQKPEKAPPIPALTQPILATVPRGQGRMEQARAQLNVRLPTDLKRRAIAGAALEGLTAGELIERLLLEYLSK